MATNGQVLRLIDAHLDGEEQFKKTIKQIIAEEEKKNPKSGYANDLNWALKRFIKRTDLSELPYNITQYFKEFFNEIETDAGLKDLYVSDETKEILQTVICEYGFREEFQKSMIRNATNLLLEGDSGCGKTFTAKCLAKELNLPLFMVKTESLIDSLLGETAKNLSKVFQCINTLPAVYLFDEFDSIGYARTSSEGSGEMRRTVNMLLQFIENNKSDSFIVATTNLKSQLDSALYRRFDYIINYSKPDKKIIEQLYINTLKDYMKEDATLCFDYSDELLEMSLGINSAEIINNCNIARKKYIMTGEKISNESLIELCKRFNEE